jgi:hypothetical protein
VASNTSTRYSDILFNQFNPVSSGFGSVMEATNLVEIYWTRAFWGSKYGCIAYKRECHSVIPLYVFIVNRQRRNGVETYTTNKQSS